MRGDPVARPWWINQTKESNSNSPNAPTLDDGQISNAVGSKSGIEITKGKIPYASPKDFSGPGLTAIGHALRSES